MLSILSSILDLPAIGLTIETIGACLVGFSHSFEAESGVKSKERTLPAGPRERNNGGSKGQNSAFAPVILHRATYGWFDRRTRVVAQSV